MPLGSSSAAPVTIPGPSFSANARRFGKRRGRGRDSGLAGVALIAPPLTALFAIRRSYQVLTLDRLLRGARRRHRRGSGRRFAARAARHVATRWIRAGRHPVGRIGPRWVAANAVGRIRGTDSWTALSVRTRRTWRRSTDRTRTATAATHATARTRGSATGSASSAACATCLRQRERCVRRQREREGRTENDFRKTFHCGIPHFRFCCLWEDVRS